jgi:hypothetical protein
LSGSWFTSKQCALTPRSTRTRRLGLRSCQR